MTLKTSKWIKCLAILLTLCMLCCFTGCNPDEDISDSSSDSSDSNSGPENYRKVGYIFSGEVDNELSFDWQLNEQRIRASNRCGIESCYIDNVSIIDFETAVNKLAQAGCTDIVAASANFANVTRVVAAKYLNLNFIGYATSGTSMNLSSYVEHTYEGAYVAGMVAAYNSGNRNIGVIVDTDLFGYRAFTNAVALGTQLVYTNSTIYTAAAHTDNEIELAISALLNKNCDVIVCYTASAHSAEYCQTRGVKFIGGTDLSSKETDYSKMLMYFYCKRDNYFLAQFKQMQLNQWGPESYIGNMGNSKIMVSKALKPCKADTQLIIDALVPNITNGSVYIFEGQLFDNEGHMKYMQTDIMSYSEIYSMNWYVQGVEIVDNFRKPQTEFPENSFEIKS